MNLLRSLFLPVLMVCLLAAMDETSTAQSNEKAGTAVGSAQEWLRYIDAGRYADAYDVTCRPTQDKITKDQWLLVMKSLRGTWGNVLARHVVSTTDKPDGLQGLDGECMIILFDTAFQKLETAQEEVVLRWQDGRWVPAGYTGGPKPEPEGGEQTGSHTETSTRDTTSP